VRRNSDRLERMSALLVHRRMDKLGANANELFQKAVQNEQILRRFQQFELKLLDLNGFKDLLETLLTTAVEYFQLDSVELWLYDPQNSLTELLPEAFLARPRLHFCSTSAALELLYDKSLGVRLVSVNADEALPVFLGEALRSAALLPLVRQGVLVGSLHFGAKGHQRFTSEKSTDFISHLASVVAVCLENCVNQERLHRLSMYDMLTQVKNRRAFHQALDNEVSLAARGGNPLSVLFIDLDHFKQINDTYGHPMGDKVLKEVAQTINDILRKTDHVCRYGGEEFALILPNCGQPRAMQIGEIIRLQISELTIANDAVKDDASAAVSVTLSMGVSCWLPLQPTAGLEEDIIRALIACSDRGVYLSKAAGRNSVSFVALDLDDVAFKSC
jgi:two-component system cell cycle response regulator